MANPINEKTSVWWDLDNCSMPQIINVDEIILGILSKLQRISITGEIQMHIYGNMTTNLQAQLHYRTIFFQHVVTGWQGQGRDKCDKVLLLNLYKWVLDNPPPANIVLLSGEIDFSFSLHSLRNLRYFIVLINPIQTSRSLCVGADRLLSWNNIITDCMKIVVNVGRNPPLELSRSITTRPRGFNPSTCLLGSGLLSHSHHS
ncbi:uncharacterized protein LOC131629039 [Vicia villosa]|uniref:uncharacterized protein LOC131629039 n=1 Tax=Vicia villosa TaxID=3911 RepID=UPI00273BA6C9|nr:uncharacterized protein LOC131629039 [Vicia villosa]